MDRLGVKAYLARPWARIEDLKDEYWAERIERLGPSEALRVAEELRQQALTLHPDWPTAEDRTEDLNAHIRLAKLLRHASSSSRP